MEDPSTSPTIPAHEEPGLKRREFVTRAGGAVLLPSLAAALAACGGTSSAVGKGGGGHSVALVSTQASGDHGPIDSMIAGLARAKKAFGLSSTRFIFVADPTEYVPTLQSFARQGFEIVIGNFPGMQQPIQTVAPQFPKTKFILLFGTAYDPPIKNAYVVAYDVVPGSYLSGLMLGSVSRSGKVGFIYGTPQPAGYVEYNLLVEGAKSVNPTIQMKGAFVGSFADPVKGAALASSMIATGVDVIAGGAADSDLGVIKAVQQHGAYFIDAVNPSQISDPKITIGTSFYNFGLSLYIHVAQALKPTWRGGFTTDGLASGVVGFWVNPTFVAHAPKAVAQRVEAGARRIKKAERELLSGKLNPPANARPF